MTRKEALKQIAQRCMDGDIHEYIARDVIEIKPTLTFKTWISIHGNPATSLDAVAKLEAEYLPGKHKTIWQNCEKTFCVKYDEFYFTAYASTEPLARLAALCLVLAEKEGDL